MPNHSRATATTGTGPTSGQDESGSGTGAGVLLRVTDVTKHYPIKKGFLRRTVGHLRAVDGVSFDVHRGETLGLVGESGCGKTTMAKMIVRATQPTSGHLLLATGGDGDRNGSAMDNGAGHNGVIDAATASGGELTRLRRQVQMVFQNPYTSLNPRHRIRDIISEPLRVNRLARGKALDERIAEVMHQVGLPPEFAIRYPHAFSGGQRQRIGIARALALHPELIVCDEPVSALDMSIQAQILNLLKDLQAKYGLTYLVISHDLGVVQHISDRVAVMYLGKLVETATTTDLFDRPTHPYTEALLAASPKPHPRHRGHMSIVRGELPDPTQRITGCPFRTRCPYAQPICTEEEPPLRPTAANPHQYSACHFSDELTLTGTTTATATQPHSGWGLSGQRWIWSWSDREE